MSQLQPLPSLFGRFTAILQEHAQLGRTLRLLRLMCAALEEGQTSLPLELTPKRLIGELRSDMGAHFGAEESPDYFGTIIAESPALAREIGGLKWEHMTMLRAVDVLYGVAQDRTRWADLPGPTRELVGQLERHERGESVLLRRLFSGQD